MDDLEGLIQYLMDNGYSYGDAVVLAQEMNGMDAPGQNDGRGSLRSMLDNRQAGRNFNVIPSEQSGNFFDPFEAERMRKIIEAQQAPVGIGMGGDPTFGGVNPGLPGAAAAFPPTAQPYPDFPGIATNGFQSTGGNGRFFEDGTYGFAGPQDKERSMARPSKEESPPPGYAQRMSPDMDSAMLAVNQIVDGARRRNPPSPPPQSKRPATPPGQAKKTAGVQSARQFTPAGTKSGAQQFTPASPKPTQKPKPKPQPGTRKF